MNIECTSQRLMKCANAITHRRPQCHPFLELPSPSHTLPLVDRESQEVKLAEEITCTTSSQVSTASVLAKVGAELVANALGEASHLPRSWSRPSLSKGADRVLETETVKIFNRTNNNEANLGIVGRGVGRRKAEGDKDTSSLVRNATAAYPTTDAAVAAAAEVAFAAGKEGNAAVRRIQIFLLRRRRDRVGLSAGASAAAAATTRQTAVETTNSELPGARRAGGEGWLDGAIRQLRRTVDAFLCGQRMSSLRQDALDSHPRTGESSPSGNIQRKSALEATTIDTRRNTNTTRIAPIESENQSSTRFDDGNVNEERLKKKEDDDGLPRFPAVPLRARARSLYTLPSRSTSRRIHLAAGMAGANVANEQFETVGLKKLEADVSARLSSARSVFGLRGSDILAAFALPPPPEMAGLERTIRSGPSITATIGSVTRMSSGSCRTPPSDALQRRLHFKAVDAGWTGLGRPWGSPSRPKSAPAIRQHQRSASPKPSRLYNTAAGDIDHGGKGALRARRFGGALTALGRRLFLRRVQAAHNARRRRIRGTTDAARLKHAKRQLRIDAAASALEGVASSLDQRECVAREELQLPMVHVEQLLDIVDRTVFADQQVISKYSCTMFGTFVESPARRNRGDSN